MLSLVEWIVPAPWVDLHHVVAPTHERVLPFLYIYHVPTFGDREGNYRRVPWPNLAHVDVSSIPVYVSLRLVHLHSNVLGRHPLRHSHVQVHRLLYLDFHPTLIGDVAIDVRPA